MGTANKNSMGDSTSEARAELEDENDRDEDVEDFFDIATL
jgi:hypothetical protein